MILDDIAVIISDNEQKTNLQKWIDEWKKDSTTVQILSKKIEKWNSETWFSDTNNQDSFYTLWIGFKQECNEEIQTLSFEERLHYFGLNKSWESSNRKDQDRIRVKLLV